MATKNCKHNHAIVRYFQKNILKNDYKGHKNQTITLDNFYDIVKGIVESKYTLESVTNYKTSVGYWSTIYNIVTNSDKYKALYSGFKQHLGNIYGGVLSRLPEYSIFDIKNRVSFVLDIASWRIPIEFVFECSDSSGNAVERILSLSEWGGQRDPYYNSWRVCATKLRLVSVLLPNNANSVEFVASKNMKRGFSFKKELEDKIPEQYTVLATAKDGCICFDKVKDIINLYIDYFEKEKENKDKKSKKKSFVGNLKYNSFQGKINSEMERMGLTMTAEFYKFNWGNTGAVFFRGKNGSLYVRLNFSGESKKCETVDSLMSKLKDIDFYLNNKPDVKLGTFKIKNK